MKIKILIGTSIVIISILFMSFTNSNKESKNEDSCDCLTFVGVQKERVHAYNHKTYYTYRYRNICTGDIEISWDCFHTGSGTRTIAGGEYEDLEYPCGTGGLDNLKVRCK